MGNCQTGVRTLNRTSIRFRYVVLLFTRTCKCPEPVQRWTQENSLQRRASGQVDETITETTSGSNSEVTSTAILTSKSKVGRYIIENQKTIQSEGKYLTFTKVVQYFN